MYYYGNSYGYGNYGGTSCQHAVVTQDMLETVMQLF